MTLLGAARQLARMVRPPPAPEGAPVVGRAIIADKLVKEYQTAMGRRRILDGLSFSLGVGEKMAILGKNGAGKSTLVRVIAGVEAPQSGAVRRGVSLSWPLGFTGGLSPAMTGLDNIRFIAGLYRVDVADVATFVDDFSELGRRLRAPVETYSSGMRMRLGIALSLAIDFDCYLVDEVISVGDQRFQRKCYDALSRRSEGKGMLLISHDRAIVRQFCSTALVLKNGRGRVFDDVDLALRIYDTL